ncbi:hypothetical protein DNK77_08170 [Enterobacter cloacae complex sp.]|nr:hypothetical protein DNK77_08170 [Enterobacter cloacae complex sp.]RAY72492.1 hypothetical protein DP199_10855 [Enterobacter kobei]
MRARTKVRAFFFYILQLGGFELCFLCGDGVGWRFAYPTYKEFTPPPSVHTLRLENRPAP